MSVGDLQCRRWDLVRGGGAQNYIKLFVAHKITRNNTLSRVHVAATELPQLLSQNTNMFVKKQPHKVAVRLRAALKLTEEKLNCWKLGACAPALHSWRRQCARVNL